MEHQHTPYGVTETETEAAAEARRLITEAYQSERQAPTFYRDDSPVPAYGNTPPVRQDDRRIVPAWAAGIAVASIGVGAGLTGIGCGAWLVLQGLASVTLTSVLMGTLPFAALAMVATAVGGAISKARAATSQTTNVYTGAVTYTATHNTSHGMFVRTRNDIRP
ncbi:hypothetical protein IPZ58_27990 [Streptomyces roseoverticillatus]|uniref:hypothetical protein n=1 Tax=Streptomyces roseoverticillatus TaxID=66429 RepID=UPI001F318A46|nr:hypothetical protein [Streptomyces roseoverticillatus]MCF3105402.1 hypothetical protein [Streptomyces roseoverticillatus]